MQRVKRWAAVILTCLCLTGTVLEVWAATKPINSINIKVSSNLEAGNSLPAIEIGEGTAPDRGVLVNRKGSHFTVSKAEWLDKASNGVKTAEEPRMLVTLEPDDVSEYYFLASYKQSNIKISGGSFVSARRNGDALEVTLRLSPIRGTFDTPKDAYWNEKNLGEARWEKPENDSGYYEVQLLRDDKNVYRVSSTTARNYNFYPYMTEAGDYTFKVRTVAGTSDQKRYGKSSEWLESGEVQITDRYVSDGKGQQDSNPSTVKGTEETVGWISEGDTWSYRYPSGSLCKNDWAQINGLWYYFDQNGKMLTGWQQINGQTYYFHVNGDMAVGWERQGDTWYYFRTETEYPSPVGSMVNGGWRVIGPFFYYFNADGSLYTGWLHLNGKRYYLNTLDNSLQGALFTGWIRRDEQIYFADANGEIVEGWYQIDGQWYYFYPETGEMAHDVSINGLYVGSDGVWRQG